MDTQKRKGVFDLGGLAWGIGQTAIIVGIVLLILAGFATATTNANVTAAIDAAITAIATIPSWFAVIVVAVVGVYLLTLVGGMAGRGRGGGV